MRKKQVFLLFTFLCIIAAGVCCIVDVAISGAITWAIYPLLSILFAWLALSTLFFSSRPVLFALAGTSLFVLPFLYLLDLALPFSSWFWPLALPIAIASLVVIWISYLLFRFSKMNRLYKLSILVMLVGMALSPLINYIVFLHMGGTFPLLTVVADIVGSAIAAFALAAWGYLRSKKNHAPKT